MRSPSQCGDLWLGAEQVVGRVGQNWALDCSRSSPYPAQGTIGKKIAIDQPHVDRRFTLMKNDFPIQIKSNVFYMMSVFWQITSGRKSMSVGRGAISWRSAMSTSGPTARLEPR